MLHEEFNQHLRRKLPQTLAGFVAQSFWLDHFPGQAEEPGFSLSMASLERV